MPPAGYYPFDMVLQVNEVEAKQVRLTHHPCLV